MLLNPYLASLSYRSTKDLFLRMLFDISTKGFQSFQTQWLILEGFADTEAKGCWLVAKAYNIQSLPVQ